MNEQAAPGAPAALGDPSQDIRGGRLLELAHREVVEEHDRFRALYDEIVHDHCDTVDSDRVQPADLRGQRQLRTDAVGGRDEHWILVPLRGLEQAGEAADPREYLGTCRAPRDLLDLGDERLVVSPPPPQRVVLARYRRLIEPVRGCTLGGWV